MISCCLPFLVTPAPLYYIYIGCPGAPGRDAGDQGGEDHDQFPRALPHSGQLHQVENLDILDNSVIETMMVAGLGWKGFGKLCPGTMTGRA